MSICSFLNSLGVEDVIDTLCPIGNLMKCGLVELSIISPEFVWFPKFGGWHAVVCVGFVSGSWKFRVWLKWSVVRFPLWRPLGLEE